MDVDVVVELYGLPPEQFTTARNRLATALKEAGDTNGSAAVKALRKPTTAAWLANHLVRVAPEQIAELTEFGDELRAVVAAGDGPRLRRLTPRRHDLVQRLVATARTEAARMGRAVTPTIAERLAETLDAALVDPGAAKLLRTGQLTSALRHIGFGVVDERGEPVTVRPLKVAKTPPRAKAPAKKAAPAKPAATRADAQKRAIQRQRAELQERLREVETEYVEAEKQRQSAEAELDANEHHIADMHTAIERLTNELDQARRELRTAQSQTRKLERALTRAERTAAIAKRRRDTQQQHLATFNE